MKYLVWLWHNTRGIRCDMAMRVVAGTVQAVLGLGVVWFSKRLIDETIRIGTTADIVRQAMLLVLLAVGGVTLRQVYVYLSNKAYIHKVGELRLRLFSGMFSRRLFDGSELHSGDVVSRLAKDIEAVSDAMATTIPQMAVMLVQLAGAFLMMHIFDSRLAWALLLFTPVAVVAGKAMALKLRRMTLAIRQDESRIMMRIQEGMEQNALLRSLQSECWMTRQLGELQESQNRHYIRRSRFTVVSRFVLGCTFSIGYLLAFVWGAWGLRSGAITFGVMTSFLQLVAMIQSPVLSLVNALPSLIHSTASIDRLEEMKGEEVFEAEMDVVPEMPSTVPWGVEFEDVSFGYAPDGRQVLQGFSHDFAPGSKTAIVGETGAGKTTLFRLILGLLEPTAGHITVYHDGERHAVGRSTRRLFVFVPQGNTLMSGTIRDNLLLANPQATAQQLDDVLHTACADFVHQLPQGIDTMLHERGGRLSEGQSQRIAIARGLLRPGSVLLLDEISASLDEHTERKLMTRIRERYPHKTFICITHRRSVAASFEHVLQC